MVAEAEKFMSEDEAQRKRIEALKSLSSFRVSRLSSVIKVSVARRR